MHEYGGYIMVAVALIVLGLMLMPKKQGGNGGNAGNGGGGQQPIVVIQQPAGGAQPTPQPHPIGVPMTQPTAQIQDNSNAVAAMRQAAAVPDPERPTRGRGWHTYDSSGRQSGGQVYSWGDEPQSVRQPSSGSSGHDADADWSINLSARGVTLDEIRGSAKPDTRKKPADKSALNTK